MNGMTVLTNAEIDRKCAELMGWHDGYGLNTHDWLWLNKYNVGVLPLKDWHPSTDLNQAWQVAEKSQGNNAFDLYKNDDGLGCECTLYAENGHNIGLAISDKPALAICLAALQAWEE